MTTPFQNERIIHLAKQGVRAPVIAKRLGVQHRQVLRVLHRAGVPIPKKPFDYTEPDKKAKP